MLRKGMAGYHWIEQNVQTFQIKYGNQFKKWKSIFSRNGL